MVAEGWVFTTGMADSHNPIVPVDVLLFALDCAVTNLIGKGNRRIPSASRPHSPQRAGLSAFWGVDTVETYPLAVYLAGVAVDDRCATGDDVGSGCSGCYEKEYRQKRNCTDHDAIVSRAYYWRKLAIASPNQTPRLH